MEVSQLYAGVQRLLDSTDSQGRTAGDCQFGVYLFVDYDGEPIYVGQTREKLRTRIRRHLTNQRTDAVAMRVLDPFEVAEVEMWPFWELDNRPDDEIKAILQQAEYTVYRHALEGSSFCAVLNEAEMWIGRPVLFSHGPGARDCDGRSDSVRRNLPHGARSSNRMPVDADGGCSGHDMGVRPMPGMVPVAEYPSRWEANVAAARLREAGYEAAVLVDPATEVAPHHVTDRVAVLVVRAEAVERAADLLGVPIADDEAERMDAHFHQRRFADRPAWVRCLTWVLVVAIPGPFAVVALWLLWRLLRSLFP